MANRAPQEQRHDNWEHYETCVPGMCEVGPADIAHRMIPEQFTPLDGGDPDRPTVTWELRRDDEIRRGRQVTHPPTVVLNIRQREAEVEVSFSVDEFASFHDATGVLRRRGAGWAARPAS